MTTVSSPFALERVIRRDRVIVALGLAAITMLAWMYLVRMAGGMHAAAMEAEMHAAMGMAGMDMQSWGADEVITLVLMWAVMMIAMMLPSAAPLMLLIVGTYRRRGTAARVMTVAFAGGYLAAWTGFSVLAALMQVLLHRTAFLSEGMASQSAIFAAALWFVAGTYQWLPFKNACLTHCRSPLHFLAHEWREGVAGAFTMGVRHGLYCVGCCWALMALLFVAGVMNLLWVAAIAAFVLAEKLMPRGVVLGRAAGVLMIVFGFYVLARS